ncbi:MAG TPA: hypothetical protein EYP19_10455, partial [Desulfobacterales bacterium]|nr:hypothetical protein [Desulfobacterales bacterium]
DHLGTPQQVTNAYGEVLWSGRYRAFGEVEAVGASAFDNPWRFPGQYADSVGPLNYNFFRSFDSKIGRYAQEDPIGLADGWNTYLYTSQNPINWLDENGLSRGARRGGGNPRRPGFGPTGRPGSWHKGHFYPSMGEQPIRRLPSPPQYPRLPPPEQCTETFVPLEHWESFGQHAPTRSAPYDMFYKYDIHRNPRGATTYDRFGNRDIQYEIGRETRHGEGYHQYENQGVHGGYGKGPRGRHKGF